MATLKGDSGSSAPLAPNAVAGVWGESDTGYGLAGTSRDASGVQGGSINGIGSVGSSERSTGVVGISVQETGVYGESQAADGKGVVGVANALGVMGISKIAYGVFGTSENAVGVFGQCHNIGAGGISGDPAGNGIGVAGFGGSGTANTGVYGKSVAGAGAVGESATGTGLVGLSSTGLGLYVSGNKNGRVCAEFRGTVEISGDLQGVNDIEATNNITANWLTLGSGLVAPLKLFRIDHPLDPKNKYLQHACVESDLPRTFYSGNVKLNARGEAVVALPRWFEALNKDASIHLTCVGAFAPVYVSGPISHNRFKIAGGAKGLTVSWHVSATRQDAFVKANPLVVEQKKRQVRPATSGKKNPGRNAAAVEFRFPPSPKEPSVKL
jgi:hypothetical protein